jgi:ribonuclease P protein component
MIASQNRFHGYGSLRFVHRNARVVRGPLCSLKYMPNSRRSTYRAAVVVSKKVSKSAVVRNRIRRRIYESVRQNVPSNEPVDLIFTVYSDQLADCPDNELQRMVTNELRAAHVPLLPGNSRSQRGIVDPKEKQ